jgi:hypothetical protein
MKKFDGKHFAYVFQHNLQINIKMSYELLLIYIRYSFGIHIFSLRYLSFLI